MGWSKPKKKHRVQHISVMWPKKALKIAERLGWKRRQLELDPSCDYCNKPLSEHNATIDHKIPKASGGTNSPSNYALACRTCNEKKGSSRAGENGWNLKRVRKY